MVLLRKLRLVGDVVGPEVRVIKGQRNTELEARVGSEFSRRTVGCAAARCQECCGHGAERYHRYEATRELRCHIVPLLGVGFRLANFTRIRACRKPVFPSNWSAQLIREQSITEGDCFKCQ